MHIPRKAGQQIEVDWAGDPAKIIDPDTGEITEAWIFVGVMTYSQYAFVEAFINEQQKSWITAHVHMYEFFGGVTTILVSDNAPTATNRKQSDKYESVLIKSYEELAQHYNTAIIPARVRAPKDKPSVEGNVGHVSTWITAALRNEQFFSLEELNQEIRKKLKKYNAASFQKKEGSRQKLFLEDEKPLLMPLPATRFELAEHRTATVQFNYHIAVDKMYYSVPYQYIKDKVDVRVTDTTIEIFKDTVYNFIGIDSNCFCPFAETVTVPLQIFLVIWRHMFEYCGILPSYKSIKNILTADRGAKSEAPQKQTNESSQSGITRGARYYGGKRS